MAWTQLYDGSISGATIVAAMGATLSANTIIIPNTNGTRVMIFKDN